MRPTGPALAAAISISCAGGVPGNEPARSQVASTPTDPTTPPTANAAKTPDMLTFVDLLLPSELGLVVVDDTRDQVPSPIPEAAPSVEYFRSYRDGGEPHLFLFTWDGFPTRDRGPMQAVESWTLAIDTSEAKVSRTSLFFGQAQEVLVAHFEGPAPAKRRYMIYTKRPDRGAFEALLRGIRFAPTT